MNCQIHSTNLYKPEVIPDARVMILMNCWESKPMYVLPFQ